MEPGRFSAVLKAALLAGVVAGLLLGLFHFVFTEPVIERAIGLEEAHAQDHGPPGQAEDVPLVSREVQRAMLVVGSALYGLLVGLIFAVAFQVLGRRVPGRWPGGKALILAGLLWWAVAFLPFMKYPGNPPGVGDPATLSYRQTLLVSFIALSALALAIGGLVNGLSGRRWPLPEQQGRRLALSAGVYGALVALLYILMPANPDPVTAPGDLIWQFRLLSLLGQMLFWGTLGGASAILLGRFVLRGRGSV